MEHKLSPVATPACRAPAGRPRSMQWWSFIVSLVSSKRMTCSSAMYSDTATLTLKYHIRHITDVPRHARCPEKSFGEPPRRGGSRGIEIWRAEVPASALPISASKSRRRGRTRIGDIDITPRKVGTTPSANRSRISPSNTALV